MKSLPENCFAANKQPAYEQFRSPPFEVLWQHHTMKRLGQLKGLTFGHSFSALPDPVLEARILKLFNLAFVAAKHIQF